MVNKNNILKLILTLLLVACAAIFALSRSMYTEALADSFFAFALASVLILHFRVRPKWQDAVLVLAITLALATIDFKALHYAPRLVAWLSFAGIASFLIMAVRATWTESPGERRMLLYAWVPAVLFVASDFFASDLLAWTAAAHHKTLDLYLLSFDYSTRVEWPFVSGQAYAMHYWLHTFSLIAYVGLALPVALVYAGRLVRFGQRAFPAMLAFLITGPVGVVFYNLFPAAGPHSLFQNGFPFIPFPMAKAPQLLLEPLVTSGPRNAMPSLHMAWMLLAWWYSRGLSRAERVIVFLFLAMTVFATLGTGEHWLADLIVAFPFAILIQAVSEYSLSWNDQRRLMAFFFGAAATLGWLVMLRYGAKLFWTSPVVPWALSVATVALSNIRQETLAEAVEAAGRLTFDETPRTITEGAILNEISPTTGMD